MNSRQINALSRATERFLLNSPLSSDLNAYELQLINWNTLDNTWLMTTTNRTWMHEFEERKLDAMGCYYLKPKMGLLNPSEDAVKAFRDRATARKHIDTIITQITPTGYDEIIIATPNKINARQLNVLNNVMPKAISEFKEFTKNFTAQWIRHEDVVRSLHKNQSNELLSNGCSNNMVLQFENISLNLDDIQFIKNMLFQCFESEHQVDQQNKLMKKLGLTNSKELMTLMLKSGVVDYIAQGLS